MNIAILKRVVKTFLESRFFRLLAQIFCMSGIILGFVALMFLITSDDASVMVEITEIPMTWSVNLLNERADLEEHSSNGFRGQVFGKLKIKTGQECVIAGFEDTSFDEDIGFNHVIYSGYFVSDGVIFKNANLIITPLGSMDFEDIMVGDYEGEDDDWVSMQFNQSQPVIFIEPLQDSDTRNKTNIFTQMIGTSVWQELSYDGELYGIVLNSEGQDEILASLAENNEAMLIDDMTLSTSLGFRLSFEDCLAYIIDDEGYEYPVEACDFYFDSDNASLHIGSFSSVNGNRFYEFTLSEENDFSVAASEFTDMFVYGIGNLSVSVTAKEQTIPLNDKLLELHSDDVSGIKDNIYTFEHTYHNDNGEKNVFRLNAQVNEALIAGESILPNFWSWFRESVYDNPLSFIAVIIGELTIVGFIGKKGEERTRDEEE